MTARVSLRTRLPVWPTVITAIMLPILVALGFWQIARAEWKQRLLADLESARALPRIDLDAEAPDRLDFRDAVISCRSSERADVSAARSHAGQSGYGYRIPCQTLADGTEIELVLGWAQRPDVLDRAAVAARFEGVLVASGSQTFNPAYALYPEEAAVKALAAAAPPARGTLTDNHLAYAVQWFLLAAVLGAIYALYFRGWRRRRRHRLSSVAGPPPSR